MCYGYLFVGEREMSRRKGRGGASKGGKSRAARRQEQLLEAKGLPSKSLLEQLLDTLEERVVVQGDNLEIVTGQRKPHDNEAPLTKGEALMKAMVDEALAGDQRMMAHIIKFMEKLDALYAARIAKGAKEEIEEVVAQTDREILLRFCEKEGEVN
jgi:hypothetical protein